MRHEEHELMTRKQEALALLALIDGRCSLNWFEATAKILAEFVRDMPEPKKRDRRDYMREYMRQKRAKKAP